tara:strand:+ start:344 stop:763 length:420 start_codon:yes stop_codon:yes gene_type:complete
MEKVGQGHTNISYTGQAGEHLICYLFHMWHYNIYQPLNPKNKVDFIVERDGRFRMLQVKTIGKDRDYTYLARARWGDKKAERYVEGDFDYLCVAKFPHVYVVPFDKLGSKTNFSLNKYPEYCYDLNNPETYTIRPNISI